MTFVIGIIGLSILVFFHELGHFTAAKMAGVKVEAFSVGMGPVLLRFLRGGTEFRLSLIPLGGYCSMKGEGDFQAAIEQGLKAIEGDEDSFYGTHPLKRLAIAFAGPFANFFFGFLAFFVVALLGYEYYSAGTKVLMSDEVYPDMSSPAHEAGMQSGDEIVSLNDTPVDDFAAIAEFVASRAEETIHIEVLRDGQPLFFDVKAELDKESSLARIGVASDPSSVTVRCYPKHGFFSACAEGIRQCFTIIVLTGKGVRVLFMGAKLSNAVSGPARMTSMLGSAVKEGFAAGAKAGVVSTLQFLALLSVSLFLMNLLPVPVLDGGLILFAFAEFVLRRKMHPKLLYYVQFVGIAFVGLLLILAISSDAIYFLKR